MTTSSKGPRSASAGIRMIGMVCGVSWLLLSTPSIGRAEETNNDEFPGQRQGGGTHLHAIPDFRYP